MRGPACAMAAFHMRSAYPRPRKLATVVETGRYPLSCPVPSIHLQFEIRAVSKVSCAPLLKEVAVLPLPSRFHRFLSKVHCRRARNWNIRRSADQDRCNRVRCGSASCEPDTSGSEAVRSELATVRGEHKFQACAMLLRDQACSTLNSRKTGNDEASMPHGTASDRSILLTFQEFTVGSANVFDRYMGPS
jgi:hypothetical protein